MQQTHHIVVVGGGAGGLELVTRLGKTLGKSQRARITLVDANLTHIWKPLWHELAAGTLNSSEDTLNYIVHGYQHHFSFQWGALTALDRANKSMLLSSVNDENGQQILPERTLTYDTLVIAIGSVSHDFNVRGVKENCFFLDSHHACQGFYQQFLKNLLRLQEGLMPTLEIAIVGGGATGVELAAELQFTCDQALKYKQKDSDQLSKVSITVIESAPRILPMLSEKISSATQKALTQQNIKTLVNAQVKQVDKEQFHTQSGLTIPAHLKLWTAGIKAPAILSNLGLETNTRHQLRVRETLQSTWDDNIFAFGDCAHCPQPHTDQPVAPRAQAAHQQATLLARSLRQHVQYNKPLLHYHYRDRGSLISLSHRFTLGSLMGKALSRILLEGRLARLAYLYLYRSHQAVLHGWWRVALLSIGKLLMRPVHPRLKLH